MIWLLLKFLLSSYYPEMGAPHDTMDACLQGWYKKETQIQVKKFESKACHRELHVPLIRYTIYSND